MTDQVTDEPVVLEENDERSGEMALPSSSLPAETPLRRIVSLLCILVAGLLIVFGYFASSICITVILAAFLAILFDPLVVQLERLRLPRSLAAGARLTSEN